MASPRSRICMGTAQIVPGLERAIEGLTSGAERSVTVTPADAYGDYDPQAVLEVEREDFPNAAQVEVGDEFVAESADGEALPITVLEVRDDAFVVDTNHPLAGETLRFEVTVLTCALPPTPKSPKPRALLGHEHPPELITLGKKPIPKDQPS